MASTLAAYARELEILVARAARAGRLDPRDLLPTYARLEPGCHPYLNDERRFDVDAVVAAFESLPSGILDAPSVQIVPEIAQFDHAATPCPAFPSGYLDDGTLLIEAGRGLIPLINLTAPLCLLVHEALKARSLLGVAVHVESDLTFSDAAAPEEPGASERFAADDPLAESAGAIIEGLADEVTADTNADDTADDGGGQDAPDDEEEEGDDADEAAWVAHAAIRLGLTQATLSAAIERSDGAVLSLFDPDAEIPVLHIHADVDPARSGRRAAETANHVVATLAEMGLIDRPLHLWIGSPVITDCLSPYARELRQVMLSWATQNPAAIGDDVTELPESVGEDLLYGIMHDFLRNRDGLTAERDTADRTVGILRSATGGLPFEIIDLGRIDAALCDARLPSWTPASPAPVILRLTPDIEDDNGIGLRTLLDALGRQIAGATVILEGTTLNGETGSILLPHLMLRWAGEEKLTLPGTVPLDPAELESLTDASVQTGAVLSVSSAALLSPDHISDLTRAYRLGAVEVGGAGIIAALADARWRGTMPAEVSATWALVGSRLVSTGRPAVSALGACAALAIAVLRRIVARPVPDEPEPEPPRRKKPSPRALYIKA